MPFRNQSLSTLGPLTCPSKCLFATSPSDHSSPGSAFSQANPRASGLETPHPLSVASAAQSINLPASEHVFRASSNRDSRGGGRSGARGFARVPHLRLESVHAGSRGRLVTDDWHHSAVASHPGMPRTCTHMHTSTAVERRVRSRGTSYPGHTAAVEVLVTAPSPIP
jgi:hypothetical protein